jgi:hypothetical protein
VDEFQSDLEAGSEEVFRASMKKKVRIGLILFASLLLLPLVIFLMQRSLPAGVSMILIFVFPVIGVLSALISAYYAIGSTMLFRNMDILRQIAPPNLFIEGKLAVLNKDPVYAIAQWGSNALFFVAFFQSERSFEQKAKLPRAIWKWEYNHSIGDIKVARRESTFTIPLDEGTYYTGNGILYSLLLERTVIVTVQKAFTAEQLNRIVESLAREVGSHGSVDWNFNNEF